MDPVAGIASKLSIFRCDKIGGGISEGGGLVEGNSGGAVGNSGIGDCPGSAGSISGSGAGFGAGIGSGRGIGGSMGGGSIGGSICAAVPDGANTIASVVAK